MTDPSYAAWIGRREIRTDRMDGARAQALRMALGQPVGLSDGDPLPLLHHWLYFWDVRPPAGLTKDGHPARGGFLPPVALPRRMWAGGRLVFHQPLRIGEAVERTSTISAIETKTGRSGTLVFVTVTHDLVGAAGLAIREVQDLVFREAAAPGQTAPAPEVDDAPAAWTRTVAADVVLLFRYSALMMNGHRIHYDLPYAVGEEGYDGLVVQGPLQAQLMIDLAQAHGQVRSFAFRGISPATHMAPLAVMGSPTKTGAGLWTRQSRRRCMTADVDFAP